MNKFLPLVLLAFWMGDLAAADFSISVRDENNNTVAGAVVTLTPRSSEAAARVRPTEDEAHYKMVQKDFEFAPHILAVPKGKSVSFPNQDTVRHHVYSFSKAKRFALSLYGGGQSPSVTFEETGIVVIGCNIHDNMKVHILVYDAPFSLTTDEKGGATLNNLLSGDYLVQIWHPRFESDGKPVQRLVTIAGDSSNSIDVSVPLRPKRRPIRSSYH